MAVMNVTQTITVYRNGIRQARTQHELSVEGGLAGLEGLIKLHAQLTGSTVFGHETRRQNEDGTVTYVVFG